MHSLKAWAVMIAACVVLCFSSCSFNKLFLQPDKLPKGIGTITITRKATRDTIQLRIGPGFQPSFTDKNGNAIKSHFKIESVVFKGASGNKLCGWFLKTNTFSDRDITMLFMHGNGGNLLSEYPSAAAFAERGINVFIFDYSGYGFSEGKATRDNVLKDAQAALDYLLTRPDALASRLIIYGQSLGGNAALVLAERNQSKISAVITEGAFSAHKDISAYRSRPFGFIARLLVAEKYSAKKSVRSLHKAVLIVHSTEDETIPYRMGEVLFRNANAPKYFYEIKHGHINGPQYYADSLTERIMNLVGKGR